MLRKRNNAYHLIYREDGKRREYSLGKITAEDAKNIEETFKNILAARRNYKRLFGFLQPTPPTLPMPSAAPPPMSMPMPAQPAMPQPPTDRIPLTKLLAIAQKRHSITKDHALVWEKFVKDVNVCYADEVTPQIALRYLDTTYSKNKPKTYNTYKGILNTVFKSAMIDAGLATSPFAALPSKSINGDVTHHRNFTTEECRKILAYTRRHPYWHCICMLALYTGQRLETCQHIAPEHYKDGAIVIMPGKTARFGRSVYIPVMPVLAKYLSRLDQSKPERPFCEQFTPMCRFPDTHKRYFAGLLDELNIHDENGETASFSSFRCTFITKMSELGLDEKTIGGIVGHTDKKTTKLYNHDTESLKKAIEKLGDISFT